MYVDVPRFPDKIFLFELIFLPASVLRVLAHCGHTNIYIFVQKLEILGKSHNQTFLSISNNKKGVGSRWPNIIKDL